MKEFFFWWLGVEAVGVAAFPLAYAFFRRLPDGGFAFSKVVGLVLLSYGLWAGAVAGLYPNSRGSVLLLLLVMAGLSVIAAGRHRRELVEYLRSGWRYVAFVEGLFFLVLLGAVYIRSFAPEIVWGEKQFELAFLNSVHRSEFFPPADPWLAGRSISYYYFGYVVVSALTKLTGLTTSVTFYLGLSLMAALAAVTAFGLVYNLIAAGSGGGPGPTLAPRAAVFGLAAGFLMLIVSNLEGVFELLARYGVGSSGFYGLVGIAGLDGPYDCAAAPRDCASWYPTRFFWWWKATRMGSGDEVQEFPFFSFQFGDLHPHVLVMPLLITLLAVGFLLVLSAGGQGGPRGKEQPERLDALWWLRHPWRFLFLGVMVGATVFTDAWALPLSLLVLMGAAAVRNWTEAPERPLRAAADTLAFLLPLAAAAFLFYLPYYQNLDADAGRGLRVIQTAATLDGPPPESEVTRPLHFLIFWGPILWVSLSFLIAYLYARRREAVRPGRLALASAAWAAPLALWAAIVLGKAGPAGFADELAERGPNLVTLLIIAGCVTAAALAFLHRLRRCRRGEERAQLFVFMLAGIAFLMLLGAELYFVKDIWGWRLNTVFRFWHQGWIVLSLAGGYGLYRLTRRWRLPAPRPVALDWQWAVTWGLLFGAGYTALVALDPWDVLHARWWTATLGLWVGGASLVGLAGAAALGGARPGRAWGRLGWVGASAVVLGAALVYPVTVTFERTEGFTRPQSLNGLVHVQRGDPGEYEAIQWLGENVKGTPVVLEAVGDDFSDFGRVSARTGLPAVVGWVGHELQWRGPPDADEELPFTDLPALVARIYETTDPQEALALLLERGVEYVYVGPLERQQYGEEGLAKFREFMIPVFENGSVTIYRMPAQTAVVGRVGEGG